MGSTIMPTRFLASTALAVCCLAFSTNSHAASAPTYSVVDKVAGADGGWDFANVDPVRGILYVARTDAVMAMDLTTHKVTPALAPANGSHQALPIDGGKTVVQTDGKSGLTRFIDAATGRIIAQVPSGQKPDSAFYDAVTGKVVVMSPGNDTITSIDAGTHKVIGTMKLAGGLEFAVTNGKGGAFINLEDAAKIAEVDLAKGRLLRKIDLPGCEGPTGLARFAHGTRLISACANGVALVIDTASGKTVATLPIGKDADAVLLDEARALAFVPCGGSGTLVALSIADANHVTVAQVIPTQVGAKTGALDPRDGRIYLPAATLAAPAPGAKRGKPLPGTFTILIVAPQA
jgi:DNA-binding beta-propeller fold protein YncE